MSRFAVFSDIHGNLYALEAVLADLEKRNIDAIWYLGDVVVYGPHPTACIDRLRQACERWPFVIMRGNNDDAVVKEWQKTDSQRGDWLVFAGIADLSGSHQTERRPHIVATDLIHSWTSRQLTEEYREWLQGLPAVAQSPIEHVLLVHASPCDPVGEKGNYLHEAPEAEEAWLDLPEGKSLCFFGHTHRATVFRRVNQERLYDNTEKIHRPSQPVKLDGRPLLVNPGSVGQPRDGLPTAAYAVYDDRKNQIEFYRVEYGYNQTIVDLQALREALKYDIARLNGDISPAPYEHDDNETAIAVLCQRLKEAL